MAAAGRAGFGPRALKSPRRLQQAALYPEDRAAATVLIFLIARPSFVDVKFG
jgi:hypothetical protein